MSNLLNVYNEYLWDEWEDFNDEDLFEDGEFVGHKTLPPVLGLMYSTIEDETDGSIREVEYYYDTKKKEYVGLLDGGQVYSKSASFEDVESDLLFETFDTFYSLMCDVYYEYDL